MNSVRVERISSALVVTITVIVSGVFRSTELNPPSLWVDDAWVALISRYSWTEIWHTSLTSVGFRAIVGMMITIFGDSTTAAQSFSFIAGLAAIPGTYIVARRLGSQYLAALFSACLVAASPLLVTYSTRVKQYTGEALFALAIASSVIWVVEDSRQLRRWWLLALLCSLSIAFSGILLLVVGPAVVASVVCSWKSRRDWMRIALPALLVLGAFGASWYLVILKPASADESLRLFSTTELLRLRSPSLAESIVCSKGQ
jgi:4-amino-4-deoxy-L-arabinose transferase-like glycosyltransferase